MESKLITIFGGSGFIGSYIVEELAKTGAIIQIVCRDPNSALHLKTAGPIGKIILTQGNIRDEESVKKAVKGSYAVINAVGILYESRKQYFASIHAQGAELLAKAAKDAGVERFIHFSALGVDAHTKSRYLRSKATGEKAVISAFPEANIIRPSIVFGAEDNFFNKFSSLAKFSPILPLIGGGKTLFQPVYVGDIARAIHLILKTPYTIGKIFECGGPRIYSFKQLIQLILEITHKKRLLLPIPFSLASLIGMFLELLPSPLLTRDQVKILMCDSIITPAKNNILTLDDLGIETNSLEITLPSYLL